jgi:hypothetical protein
LSDGDLGFELSAPQGINASDGEYVDGVLVAWEESNGAYRYEILRCSERWIESCSAAGSVFSPTTQFEDSGASRYGDIEYFRVKACSEWNGCTSTAAPDIGNRLQHPYGVQATRGSYPDKVRISWNPGIVGDRYEVYRCSGPTSDSCEAALGSVDAGTFQFDDLEASAEGGELYYWARSCSVSECSDFSSRATGFRLGIPTGVMGSMGEFTDKIIVTWNDVNGEARYEVVRCESSSEDTCSPLIAELDQDEVVLEDADSVVHSGALFYYRVRACTLMDGCTDWSESGVGTTSHKIFVDGFESLDPSP